MHMSGAEIQKRYWEKKKATEVDASLARERARQKRNYGQWICLQIPLEKREIKTKTKKTKKEIENTENNRNDDSHETRGPQALTVTWVSETLHWLLVKRAHICISTAPS